MFIDTCVLKCMLVFYALLLSADYGSASSVKDPNICGTPICKETAKFKYQPKILYEYKYTVDIRTLFEGTSKNESSLHIQGDLRVEFLTPCEGVLEVKQITLTEKPWEESPEEKSELPQSYNFAKAITQYPLRFSFVDGVIAELCPNIQEPTWVLNFKRGILSSFQNSMERLDVDFEGKEIDVNGICETKYILEEPENILLRMTKSKDLSNCENRYKHLSILQTTPYVFRQNYQALPIMNSSSECEILIDHNVHETIKCTEEHVFQPFSGPGSGAKTIISHTIKLQAEINTTLRSENAVMKRTSLLFDHEMTPKPTSGELKTARDYIKTLCILNKDDIEPEFPSAFAKFIGIARVLSYNALLNLYDRANIICKTGRKHLIDALPFIQTNAAIGLTRDIILKPNAVLENTNELLFGLSLFPRPDLTTLRIITPLMKNSKADSQYLLSVSSVVRTFCRNNQNCGEVKEVNDIISSFERQLDSKCNIKSSREKQERALVILKSLGNIGIATQNLTKTLKNCVEHNNLPMELRVAAIEAHRRMPCKDHRDYFLKLFRDQVADTELRIAAYLEVMKCPDYNVIRTIKHTLKEETVNQVGSFVWSHLENLREASLPSRVPVQGLLQDKDLYTKFSRDFRKFSHNFEWSVFFDEYNVGGSYESNVIISPKSYIPRSAMFNITVDLFGESINIFEATGRMEGFEQYIESIFGPNGILSSKKVQETVDKIRTIRSAKSNLLNEVEKLPNVIDNNFDDPKLSLGMKIFGNEFNYKSFVGNDEIKEALESINPVEIVKKLLSGQEINFNKAAQFLDTSYVVPTGVGFPLSLNALGTAAVNLNMSGYLNMENFTSTHILDVKGKIRPSVSLDIVGTMGVDAYYAGTAIKLKTNLYTSAAIEGQLNINGTKFVSLSFNLPKNKTEVITATSELIVVQSGKEEQQAGRREGRFDKHICTWSSVHNILGLKFCADLSFPNTSHLLNASTYFLNGPTKFGLSLQKADPTAKLYLLQYKWEQNDNTSLISFVFDTPGSQMKREISVKLNLDMYSQNLTMLLHAGDRTYEAHGIYRNTEEEKYLTFHINTNGDELFDSEFGLKVEESRYGYTYLPHLYVALMKERILELTGTFKWAEKKGVKQYDIDMDFDTKKLSTNFFGYLRETTASFSYNLKLNYKFLNSTPEYVRMEAELNNRSTKSVTEYIGKVQMETSAYPHFDLESSMRYQAAHRHADFKFDIVVGTSYEDERKRFTAHSDFTYFKTPEGSKLNTSLLFKKPINNIDIWLGYNYQSTGSDIIMQSKIRYSSGKEIVIFLDMTYPRGTLTFFQVHLNVSVPSLTPFIAGLKIHEKVNNEFDLELYGTWFSGHNFFAKGLYQDKSTAKTISHNLKLQIKSPSFDEIILVCKLLNNDYELKIDFQADQLNEKYALLLTHATPSETEIETFAELRFRKKVYSVINTMNFLPKAQVKCELHLDNYRDIHVEMESLNEATRKELALEIKWDVNRDPGQKFAFGFQFARPEAWNYTGAALVYFPNRELKGNFLTAIKDRKCVSLINFSWSPDDVVETTMMVQYEYESFWKLDIESELKTPFAQWRKTSFSGRFHNEGNMVKAGASMHWHDSESIALDFYGNYMLSDTDFMCELNSSLRSSIDQVPPMSASFFHSQSQEKFDTNLYLQYKPTRIVRVKSSWIVNVTDVHTNVSGSVLLVTPFPGYEKSSFNCKGSLSNNSDILGAAELDIDRKKYRSSVQGHMKYITNSMLVINITTPIYNYTSMTARIGYSEAEKHFVALISMPSKEYGVEILLNADSFSKFNVILFLGTPLDFLRSLLLVAKLDEDMVEFRAGWDVFVIGFVGKWHYFALVDFDYSYKLYTFIPGFEYNAVTAKVLYESIENVHIECLAQISDTKLGVKVEGSPKDPIFRDLPSISEKSSNPDIEDTEENQDYDEDNNPLSWKGLIEIDTVLYETMKCNLEIDKKKTLYIISATVTLPDGVSELYDEFDLIDMMTMSNKLLLQTPCDCFKQLEFNYKMELIPDMSTEICYDIKVLTYNEWKKGDFKVNYFYNLTEENEYESHLMNVGLHTPFDPLKKLDIFWQYNVTYNTHKTDFVVTTELSRLGFAGTVVAEPGIINMSLGVDFNSPVLQIPPLTVTLLQNLVQPDRQLLFVINASDIQKHIKVEGVWNYQFSEYLKVFCAVETPFSLVSNITVGVVFDKEPDNTSFLNVDATYSEDYVHLASRWFQDKMTATLKTTINNYRNCKLTGDVLRHDNGTRTLEGKLETDNREFSVRGMTDVSSKIPLKTHLELFPSDGGESMEFTFSIVAENSGYKTTTAVTSGKEHTVAVIGLYYEPVILYTFDFQVDTANTEFKLQDLRGNLVIESITNISAELSAKTRQNSERMSLNGAYVIALKKGFVKSSVNSAEMKGNFETVWLWKYMEDMAFNIILHSNIGDMERGGYGKLFYKNPRKSFKTLITGVDINLNKNALAFGANATVNIPTTNNVSMLLNLKLPDPYREIHSLEGQFAYKEKDTFKKFLKYTSHYGQAFYITDAEGSMTTDNIHGHWTLKWDKNSPKEITNFFEAMYPENMYNITYYLETPHYLQKTFVAQFLYEYLLDNHNTWISVRKPDNNTLSEIKLNYISFENMEGHIYTKTPIIFLPHVTAQLKSVSDENQDVRYVHVAWPNNTALFDSTCNYKEDVNTSEIKGSVLVELPITTRHIGKTQYEYKAGPDHTTGHSLVEYNGEVWLEGKYNCDTKSLPTFLEDVVNIEIQNRFIPIGVLYTHQLENIIVDGTKHSTKETKDAEIFQLYNKTNFAVKGQMVVETRSTGQDVYLSVTHGNRTIELKTDYDHLDTGYVQKTHLQLDPQVWADWDFTLQNKTTREKEEKEFDLTFTYPKRDFTLKGCYEHSNEELFSEASLVWDKKNDRKSIGGSISWKRDSVEPHTQHAIVTLKHPSFQKNVTFETHFTSKDNNLIHIASNVIYSPITSKKLSIIAKLLREKEDNTKKYSYEVFATHPATRLDMKLRGFALYDGMLYEMHNAAEYKRTYLPMQKGELKAFVNTALREINFEKNSQREISYLRGKVSTNFPLYILTAEVRNGSSASHAKGKFFIDVNEKLLGGNMNVTNDSPFAFKMHGEIPDARNAMLYACRVYDDVEISDISFYLRLNHSRLLTSRLKTHPDLFKDMKDEVEQTYFSLSRSFNESVQYWKVYIKAETIASINDIWKDARPIVQKFLDDISKLAVTVEDFEELKKFLNQSYNSNEFRIRDFISMASFIIDELSIRGHIDSLPQIVNEMWGVMGESGNSVRSSLVWIIEKIENSYTKTMEFINGLFNGSSAVKISTFFESMGQQYEKIVRDMHVSFTTQLETLWNSMKSSIGQQINTLLQTIEPSFIEFIHYIEAHALKLSNELVDFVYERRNDIIKSPVFARVANITSDIDRLYKDFMKNDTITNIKKYSHMVYEFLKEKYFTMVPFGTELYDVISEIVCEFKELQNLQSVQFVLARSTELYENVIWIYKRYDIGNRIQYAIQLIHLKMTDMTQTALQAENRYRQAKTMFIFDPDNGLIEVEMKLPMSWHAFNETPKVEEIQEYQAISKGQNFFTKSNRTFWSLYYDYKQLTEPSNWLPPFHSQAILAGPQHFMTFDKRFFEYRGSCSYLLATDFVDKNFTMIVNYKSSKTNAVHEISVIFGKNIVHIDLFHDSVKIESSNGRNKLPVEIMDTYIYQESTMINIENKNGLSLQCNMKFDVCTLRLSGFYYGKTAGLFGTMDHEPTTDFLTSKKVTSTDVDIFAHSWTLEPDKCDAVDNLAVIQHYPSADVYNVCETFFKTKASPFSTCFPTVDPRPFMTMCINSNTSGIHEACTAAIAYMQACLFEYTPLRIPAICVKCHLVDGTELNEGNFIKLENGSVPRSTDVVFIVEAKSCNADLTKTKNFGYFLSILHKELANENILNNRYSVVVFGGDNVYDQPRSIVLNNEVFATHQTINQYFEHIPTGNGNEDIFNAIRYASTLLFRAGVSKTIILMPCSNCDPSNMTLDYSTLHHLLVENDITLHILMNESFMFDKKRAKNSMFGIDATHAYMKRDFKNLTGSPEMRRQVKLPKSLLGYCTPLALESNGTIFSADKLQTPKKNILKKFSTVFAKRIAMTAVPYDCQTCECTAHNDGNSFMECLPCHYPTSGYIEYDFNEDVNPDDIDFEYEEESAD